MKYAVAAAAMAATAAAITTVGDGVPLIYAPTPYPDPPYKGTQYNATVINGVPFNASNEWPCLTAEKYFTIPPACSKDCLIGTFKNTTLCDDDDFTCHCSADGSAELDKYVIPCLSAADSPCTGEEIGELANFVHAALCPYFQAVSHEDAYGHCDGSWFSSATPTPTPSSSSKAGGYWPKPSATSSSSSSEGWAKPTESYVTSTQTVWTKKCSGPTTFWVGPKTWTVTEATTITVTDYPITWTKPVATGTWAPIEWTTPAAPVEWSSPAAPVEWSSPAAPVEWTTPAAPVVTSPAATWVYSTASVPAGGWAKGTAAYSASPVEFTGAASNNKVAGAVAAVAAGAALLI